MKFVWPLSHELHHLGRPILNRIFIAHPWNTLIDYIRWELLEKFFLFFFLEIWSVNICILYNNLIKNGSKSRLNKEIFCFYHCIAVVQVLVLKRCPAKCFSLRITGFGVCRGWGWCNMDWKFQDFLVLPGCYGVSAPLWDKGCPELLYSSGLFQSSPVQPSPELHSIWFFTVNYSKFDMSLGDQPTCLSFTHFTEHGVWYVSESSLLSCMWSWNIKMGRKSFLFAPLNREIIWSLPLLPY